MSAVKALAWCPYNFDVLASGGGMRDRCIKLWNKQKGTCITSVETGSQICGLEWNKNYKEIASGHGLSPNVDRNDLSLWKYPSMVNVLVLNMGHHWNSGKLNANQWVMYVGEKCYTDRRIAEINSAKNLTIHNIIQWVNGELPKCPGLKAFYRSISPRHFFNGDWIK